MRRFQLRSVRLVGFHNYEDELIPVGGNLFIVGSNESGKTTVLDAIHLVLSGEQDLDWNAAARMAGARNEGRTLQGIILRADMTGRARRTGGSISYAVLELHPTNGNGGPISLVFGASATDMRAKVRRWGAIVRRTARDLPLTREQPDGSRRIVDREELDEALDGAVFKTLSAYRAAVAGLLFHNRSEFDHITELWRKAKSYRELAKGARSVGELFRAVLPAPDPGPFQKIAAGFQDLSEIEQHLRDLAEDVRRCQRLQNFLEQTRHAQRTVRELRYAEATRSRDAVAGRIDSSQKELSNKRKRRDELRSSIEEMRGQRGPLIDRIASLRTSAAFSQFAHRDDLQARLFAVEQRMTLLTERHRQATEKLKRRERDRKSLGKAATEQIRFVKQQLTELAESLRVAFPDRFDAVQELHDCIPAEPTSDLPIETITEILSRLRKEIHDGLDSIKKQIEQVSCEQNDIETEKTRLSRQSERLERHADLVPQLAGLDDLLDQLRQAGIDYQLLYQTVRFRPETPMAIQGLIEAVVGLERLATLVVAPDQVAIARRLVNELGATLRVLDADVAPMPQSPAETSRRLIDYLTFTDERVQRHVAGVLDDGVLLDEPPADGVAGVWWLPDGRSSEHGARYSARLGEPLWIDQQQRSQTRQTEVDRCRTRLVQIDRQLVETETQLGELRKQRTFLSQAIRILDELQLPWSLKQRCDAVRQMEDEWKLLEDQVRLAQDDLATEQTNRDTLAQALDDLDCDNGASATDRFERQFTELEQQRDELTTRIAEANTEDRNLAHRIGELNDAIADLQTELVTAQSRWELAAEQLRGYLTPQEQAQLEEGTWECEAIGVRSVRNLPELVQSAIQSEAEMLTKLRGSDGVMHADLAARFGFRIDDEQGQLEIRDRQGQTLQDLLAARSDEERQWRETLDQKTRDLFERVLARDLLERLQADLQTLRKTTDALNDVLEPLVFGHSRFRFRPRRVAEHRRLIELIERPEMSSAAERDELRRYLEDRRDELTTDGEVPGFLDYRNWFDYQLQLHPADQTADTDSFGTEDMVRGSGGAQATHHYLLLLAMASLLYDRAGARIRLLMMDEAFYGLDAQRKELLLRCAQQLDLDCVIATPDLDGTIQDGSIETTTVLVERDRDDRVHLIPFVWTPEEARVNQ